MDGLGKTCADEQELLWYAAQALSQVELDRIAMHVNDCPRCRDLVKENEVLAGAFQSLPAREATHLEPSVLASFAEGAFVGTVAQSHVSFCRECQELVGVVQKVNREIEEAEPLRSGLTRLAEWFSMPAARAAMTPWLRSAPGYLLALLMLYPAYRGTFGSAELEDRVKALESPRLLSAPYALPSEAERGTGTPEIRLDGRGQAVLTFLVPVASERYRYQVELIDSNGERRFVMPDARSFDGRGTFTLFVPAETLRPGSYEIRVEEREGSSLTNVFTFPFRIGE